MLRKRLAQPVLFAALLAAIAALALLASAPRSGLAQEPPHLEVDKSADSQACETASIHLTVRGEGEPVEERVPVDVMLVLDRSGSMGEGGPPTPMFYAKQAGKALVDQLDPDVDQVGLVSYSDWASLDHVLTSGVSGFNDVKTAIDALSAGGYTNIGDGVYDAQQELESVRHNPDAIPVIVLMSNGIANRSHAGVWCETYPTSPTVCTEDAINQAATAKANGTVIFTVGLNLVWDTYPDAGDLARTVLRTMATQPWEDYYFETTDPSDLEGIFEQIALILITIAGKDVTVTEILPSNLHYAGGSAVPAPDSIVAQTLTWNLGLVSIGDVHHIDFHVTVDFPAGYVLADVYPDSRVDYLDYQNNPQYVVFPETYVDVDPCPRDFRVKKDFIPDSGASVSVSLDCTSGGVSPASASASEGSPAVFTVTGYSGDPTCTATESPIPAGYDSTGTCAASLSVGECTITNTLQLGTIIVEKQTVPDGAAGSFTFTGDVAGTISDDGQIVVSGLVPGTYSSTETVPAGWDLTSIVCDDNNSSGAGATATFELDSGETVKCTFTNTSTVTVFEAVGGIVEIQVGGSGPALNSAAGSSGGPLASYYGALSAALAAGAMAVAAGALYARRRWVR